MKVQPNQIIAHRTPATIRATDLTGRRFGKLVAIRRIGTTKKRSAIWECQCDCGNMTNVTSSELTRTKRASTKSCGCLKIDREWKHGGNGTLLYKKWSSMRARCRNPNSPSYTAYGGRGISVCSEWEDFAVFREWALNNGYKRELQIDRIDNNLGYFPDNCRWVTSKENNNNRRSNRHITYRGKTKTMTEWADTTGIELHVLFGRLKRGWSIESALETPIKPTRRLITFNGETKTLSAWADYVGITPASLNERLAKWDLERSLSKKETNI